MTDKSLDRMAERGLLCIDDLKILLRVGNARGTQFPNCGLIDSPNALLDWSLVRWNRPRETQLYGLPKLATDARELAKQLRQSKQLG